MTAKILTHFLDKCYYDSATERFYVESGMDGFLSATLSAYLGNDDSDPEGVEFNIKVIQDKAIETDATVWEEMNASYHDASGTIYFERQSTVASSTGSAISFDAKEVGGSSNLTMYGVTGVQHFGGQRVERNKEPTVSGSNQITYANPTGTSYDASDVTSVRPKNTNAWLTIDASGYVETIRDASTTVAHSIFLTYRNSSGVWTNLAPIYYFFRSAGTETTHRQRLSFESVVLDQDNLNANGLWEFKLTHTKSYTDSSVRLISSKVTPTQYF